MYLLLLANIIYSQSLCPNQYFENNRDLTNSRRPYFGLLKMTLFSNVLLMSVLFLLLLQKIYKHANTASFHETRFQLLNAFSENLINEQEFLLLEDINTSKNKEFPYYNFDYFELDEFSDDEWLV